MKKIKIKINWVANALAIGVQWDTDKKEINVLFCPFLSLVIKYNKGNTE